MRYAVLILAVAPAFAQISARPTPAAAVAPSKAAAPAPVVKEQKAARIPLSTFVSLERGFDAKLAGMEDNNGRVDLLGATRGIYLDGYGIVFTTELSLVQAPTLNTFNNYRISDDQKVRIHSAKVSRLPTLRKLIQEMAQTVASSVGQVPDGQQVVVAVRLDYAQWENTSGLPGLITAKADRLSATRGQIQLEEQ